MNVCIFFNTRIENSGALTWIGDKGLAPFRYLFNGRTIRIETRDSDQEIEIHHVASFHKSGDWNTSESNYGLKSSSTNMIKTVLSIVFLVPGLLLSTFKAAAYLYADVREKHHFAIEHFTPINREIGSVANPIKSSKELLDELRKEKSSDAKHRPTNALIIHGDGNLKINDDPGILAINPMKLILEGARIVHEPTASMSGRLDDQMRYTRKWQVSSFREVSSSKTDTTFVKAQENKSIEEALQATAPRRSWFSCKRYHMIYNVDIPSSG